MTVIVAMLICSVFVDVHRSVSGQSLCKCSSEELDCSGKNLNSLHETFQSHLNCEGASYKIHVSENKLKELNFPKEFMQIHRNASIWADDNHLTSLSGLEDWTGSDLVVRGNNFSSVDLSPWKKHLETLDISVNHLAILDLSTMENLLEVDADNNALSLLILPSDRCSLDRLDLRSNKLSVLPMEIQKCMNLNYLDVYNNNFSSLDLSRLENISTVYADNNSLSHLILPSERCSLDRLDLRSNKLAVVPMEIQKCMNLFDLDVRHNNLSSLDMSTLENLFTVYADNNSLFHLIFPSERCSLYRLHLSSNKLLVLPMGIQKCMNLTYLDVRRTNLSSLDLSRLENLSTVYADNNSLSHLILPSERCSLDRLDLRSNKLAVVPMEIQKCMNLTYLDVRHNNLSSLDMSTLENLSTVYADNNSLFHLIFPSERCSLYRLDLRSNKLAVVPMEIQKCMNLTYLDVRHNNLSSLDLSTLENLSTVYADNNSLFHLIFPSERCSLYRLYLNSNKFSILPIELRKCEYLTDLSIINNNLVELDLSEMFRLVNIAAANNEMKTLILPKESCSVKRIKLTSNKLTSLHQDLFLCSRLQYIELDDNALKVFPDCLLKLMRLRSDASGRNIVVNVRENPVTLLEIFSTFRDFIQQQGLFMHLFDEDFFTIKHVNCECSEMKLEHFAPVEYCATIMCDKEENLWQHL